MRLFRILVPLLFLVGTCVLAAEESPFLALFPELAKLPAPAWLKEGVRLTYYSAAASVPGVRYEYVRDTTADQLNRKVMDENGDVYLEQDAPTPAGHGYTQLDVAALEGNTRAVVLVNSWGLRAPMGQTQEVAVPIGATGVLGRPAVTGDWWVNPAVLKNASAKATKEVKIVKMPYPLNSKTYQAMRFEYTKKNSKQVYVFDLETGLLLHANTATISPDQKRTQLTETTFKGMRQRNLPWVGDAPPAWLATAKAFNFAGSLTVSVPGAFPMTQQVSVACTVNARGNKWLRYAQKSVIANAMGVPPITEESVLVSGLAQTGSLWMPPAGLAKLKAGQTLDTDPITGAKTTVAYRGQDDAGREAVVIAEEGPAHQRLFGYDLETGRCLAIYNVDKLLYMTIDLEAK